MNIEHIIEDRPMRKRCARCGRYLLGTKETGQTFVCGTPCERRQIIFPVTAETLRGCRKQFERWHFETLFRLSDPTEPYAKFNTPQIVSGYFTQDEYNTIIVYWRKFFVTNS